MKNYRYISLWGALLVCFFVISTAAVTRADETAPGVTGSDDSTIAAPPVPPAAQGSDATVTAPAQPSDDGSDATNPDVPVAPNADGSNTTNPNVPVAPGVGGSNDTDSSTTPPQMFTLTVVTTGGNGQDTVTSDDGGIDCSASESAVCSTSTTTGAVIVLTEATSSPDMFSGWSGGSCEGTAKICTVTLTADTTVTATFAAVENSGPTNPTTPTNTTQSSGGGSSSSSSSSSGGSTLAIATPTAASLSAACDLLTTPLHFGQANDPAQVSLLQDLLNKLQGAGLTVNGAFDQATLAAVKDFQTRYASDILAPWGATTPSGYVYITTRQKLNELNCDSNQPLTQAELDIIAAYKAQAVTARNNAPKTTVNHQPATPALPAPLGPVAPVNAAASTTPGGSTTPIEVGESTNDSNTAAAVNSGAGNVFSSIGGFFSNIFHKVF